MSAPIVIHRPSATGGRRVTIRGQIVGLAHDDADVVELLRRAGLPDAEQLLDDWHGWAGRCCEAGPNFRRTRRSCVDCPNSTFPDCGWRRRSKRTTTAG
ncbi:hypothetical protein ACFWH1_09435 [Streptomyces sp. NPDC127037]|uniref:hypothetical protein n=1 Tax=Streptomyces sp. NPDC127037 TaxID=3347113 RepID=UPI003649EC69